MLTALRREVQAVLADMPVTRKPALRRSDAPDALLATDLPITADEETVQRFIGRMSEKGWRVWRHGSWLLLDAEIPVPADDVPETMEGELGCCISLLVRHPGGEKDEIALRALVKAAERGSAALEICCKGLHASWAAALREHRNLPGGLLPYLCRAADRTK